MYIYISTHIIVHFTMMRFFGPPFQGRVSPPLGTTGTYTQVDDRRPGRWKELCDASLLASTASASQFLSMPREISSSQAFLCLLSKPRFSLVRVSSSFFHVILLDPGVIFAGWLSYRIQECLWFCDLYVHSCFINKVVIVVEVMFEFYVKEICEKILGYTV